MIKNWDYKKKETIFEHVRSYKQDPKP